MAVNFISTDGWSHERWLGYRKSGVGASDFGILLGLNRWKCSLAYYQELIGVKPINTEMNFAQINGKAQEPIIANYFRYFENDHKTMVRNINSGKIVREVIEVGGYIYNDDYENMFCSPDRFFKDSRFGDANCCLEIKNEQYASHNMWEGKNPNQILQLAYQMLLTNAPYGVLLAKVGDSEIVFDEMYYKDAKRVEKIILNTVKQFWRTVEEGRAIMTQIYHAKSQYNMKLALELQQKIFKLEPEPNNNMAYLEYITDQFKEKINSIPMNGSVDLLKKALELNKLESKRKKIIEQETRLKCELATEMRINDKTEISFGKEGSVSLKNGRFNNKTK